MIEPYREGNISMWGRCICAVFCLLIVIIVYPVVMVVTFVNRLTEDDLPTVTISIIILICIIMYVANELIWRLQ